MSIESSLPSVQRFDYLNYEFIESSTSGVLLRIAHKIPAQCSKVLVFVNGRNEWIEKYPNFLNELNLNSDVGFVNMDHRGQGRSHGPRANIKDYNDYASDLKKVIDYIVPQDTDYSIVSHSMGGLISLFAATNEYIKPEKLILNSPLLRLPNKPLPSVVAKPIAKLMVALGCGGMSTLADKHHHIPFAMNKLTHCEETYEYIMQSPFRGFGARFAWVDSTFRALDLIYRKDNINKISSELFLQFGVDERVVSPLGFDLWPEAVRLAGKQIAVEPIEHAKHELFSESKEFRSIAMSNVRGWLGDSYCPAFTSS